jgi:hypothetical protein
MPEFAAYAPIWQKWSYGGHTRDEMVIRIGTLSAFSSRFWSRISSGVPSSVALYPEVFKMTEYRSICAKEVLTREAA